MGRDGIRKKKSKNQEEAELLREENEQKSIEKNVNMVGGQRPGQWHTGQDRGQRVGQEMSVAGHTHTA